MTAAPVQKLLAARNNIHRGVVLAINAVCKKEGVKHFPRVVMRITTSDKSSCWIEVRPEYSQDCVSFFFALQDEIKKVLSKITTSRELRFRVVAQKGLCGLVLRVTCLTIAPVACKLEFTAAVVSTEPLWRITNTMGEVVAQGLNGHHKFVGDTSPEFVFTGSFKEWHRFNPVEGNGCLIITDYPSGSVIHGPGYTLPLKTKKGRPPACGQSVPRRMRRCVCHPHEHDDPHRAS